MYCVCDVCVYVSERERERVGGREVGWREGEREGQRNRAMLCLAHFMKSAACFVELSADFVNEATAPERD